MYSSKIQISTLGRIMLVFVAMAGFGLGVGYGYFVTPHDESEAFEAGRRVGFYEGQKASHEH